MRQPAVAGKFYPRSQSDLREEIEGCFTSPLGPGKIPELARDGPRVILGAVVPHAGYSYSGPVAAHVYGALAKDGFPKTFVILGPNHNAFGAPIAVSTEDFQTPLGVMKTDTELASKLGGVIEKDSMAHRLEHSIEVQLPFIQYFSEDSKVLPIAMTAQDYETAKEVGEQLRAAIKGRDVVILASTDFSHYVPAQEAHAYDTKVIDQIIARDAKGVYDTVVRYNISMCGYGPVMAMLEATQARTTILFKYATSGDVTPMTEVVGYAGIVVTK